MEVQPYLAGLCRGEHAVEIRCALGLDRACTTIQRHAHSAVPQTLNERYLVYIGRMDIGIAKDDFVVRGYYLKSTDPKI